MGVKQSSDIVEEVMESLFCDLGNAEVYINNIECFSSTFANHIYTLDIVLTCLEQNGFTVNSSKCEWEAQETDWLGYWPTTTGLKPLSKNIKAITAMWAPVNIKQVHSFIGAVTYYCDMWPCRSHISAPLTDLTGKGTFHWTLVHQKASDAMKALMVKDVLLCYPDHNIPFHICTDASDYELGSVILQQNVPVALYSRKLSISQQNCTTIEKELLTFSS